MAHATGGLKDTVLNFDPFQVDAAPKSAAPAVVALQQQGYCALALCSDLVCDVSLLDRCAVTVSNIIAEHGDRVDIFTLHRGCFPLGT